MANKNKKWTPREDSILVDQVKAYPQSLKACFVIVAKTIGRTEGAVANHWYTSVSKNKKNVCFATISAKHKTFNRKNGEGEPNTKSIWSKICKLLGF